MNGAPTLFGMRPKERTPFGARLFEARKAAKLTQPKLAAMVGMSQGTLAEAEYTAQGSTFTPQLAKACGVSADWLATGQGPRLAMLSAVAPATIAEAIKAEAQQDPYELIERGLRALVIVGDDFKAVMNQVRDLAAKSEAVRAAWQERLKEAGKNGLTKE